MESRIEGPQKLKLELLYNPEVPLSGICPKWLKTGSQRDIGTHKFAAALYTVVRSYRAVTLGHFHQERDGVFSYWNSYSGYRYTFPAHNTLAKTPIPALTECLIHHQGIPHSISSDQQLFSLQMKRDSLLILIEFLGLSMFPIIWGGSWLDRIMEWLPHNVSKEKESWKAKDPRVPLRTTTSYDVSMSFPFAVPFGGWKRLGFRLTDG